MCELQVPSALPGALERLCQPGIDAAQAKRIPRWVYGHLMAEIVSAALAAQDHSALAGQLQYALD